MYSAQHRTDIKHRVGACRDLAKIRAVDDDSKRTGACYKAFD